MNWIKIDSKNETSRQEHTHTKTTSARRQPKLGDWTKSILEKRQSNYKNLEFKESFMVIEEVFEVQESLIKTSSISFFLFTQLLTFCWPSSFVQYYSIHILSASQLNTSSLVLSLAFFIVCWGVYMSIVLYYEIFYTS